MIDTVVSFFHTDPLVAVLLACGGVGVVIVFLFGVFVVWREHVEEQARQRERAYFIQLARSHSESRERIHTWPPRKPGEHSQPWRSNRKEIA